MDLPNEILEIVLRYTYQPVSRLVCSLWRDLIKSSPNSNWLVDAAGLGHIQLLHWAYKNGADVTKPEIYCRAIICNQYPTIIWLDSLGAHWREDTYMCYLAAKYGHLGLLQSLCQNDYHVDEYVFGGAAESGHTDILQWLYKIPLTSSYFKRPSRTRIRSCQKYNVPVCESAAAAGQIDVLNWMASKYKLDSIYDNIIFEAAKAGKAPVLNWVRKKNVPLTELATLGAASTCRWSFMKWLHEEKGLPLSSQVMRCIASNGNAQLIIWAIENGLTYTDDDMELAIGNGRLDIVALLYQWGVSWMDEDYAIVVENGDLAMLKYMYSVGSENDRKKICTSRHAHLAAACGWLDILQWFAEQSFYPHKNIFVTALQNSHMHILEWGANFDLL